MGRAIWSALPEGGPAGARRVRSARRGLGFVLPAAMVGFVLTVYPLVYSAWISVQEYNLTTGAWRFVGAANYLEALGDAAFWRSVRNTAQIATPSLLLEVLFGLALALALDRIPFRGRTLLISLLVAPMMIPGAAAAMAFSLLYAQQYGPLNAALTAVAGRPVDIPWVSSVAIAPYAVVIVEVWQKTSFVMLFLLAGLSLVPGEVYDAAKVDGASPWQTFRFVTLPLLRTTLLAVIIVRLIDLLKMFDLPFVLTGGGPGVATEPVSMHIVQVGFQFFRMGAGAAQSFLLLLGVGFLALGLLRLLGIESHRR
jgi:multiple sugar transport system permease protein